MIPRTASAGLLSNSPTLIQTVHRWLRSAPVVDYPVEQQGLDKERAQAWCNKAVQGLYSRGVLPKAVNVEANAEQFCTVADEIERVPFFANLPANELDEIAAHLIYISRPKGYAFFHQKEQATAGNVFFVGAPSALFAVAEGMAAGAILTMIAQTMLPEAYFKGGVLSVWPHYLASVPHSRSRRLTRTWLLILREARCCLTCQLSVCSVTSTYNFSCWPGCR